MELSRDEIMRYVRLLIEKRHLFIVSSLIIMSLIVWGSYFMPKKYKAKSTILIDENVIERLVQGIAITPSMESRIKVLRDTMLGRTIVLNVLRKLDLDIIARDEKELEMMIMEYQRRTEINVRRNNNLINVSYIDKDPMIARNYVNTLVDTYVEENIFMKREEAYGATKFLDKQVALFKEKMDKGENAIIKYRQEQGIYAAMDEDTLISEIKNLEMTLEDLRIKIYELVAARDSLIKQLKDEEPYSVTIFSKNGLEERLKSHESRLQQLLVNYNENYPEVIRLKAEIDTLKSQEEASSPEDPLTQTESQISAVNPVYQELKQKAIEIEAEIESLKARDKNVMILIEKKKQELREIPENKKKLADLIKERDSFKGVYQSLLERLGQSQVSKQMEVEDKATTFRIIEPAVLPSVPVSPNRVLMILGGIACGFLGGFAVVFILDYTNSSVKTLGSLKELGMPVLAVIPQMIGHDEIMKTKKKDILIYSMAGVYMLCILTVFGMEVLGLNYVESIFNLIYEGASIN